MDSVYNFFSKAFTFFDRRRLLLFAVIFAVASFASLILSDIKLREDVQPLLPDGSSDAAIDFRFLQQAPFVQKVIFNVRADSGTDRATLVAATEKLAEALKGPYYKRVVSGPGDVEPERLLSWILQITPSLMTEEDMKRIKILLTPGAVRDRFREMRADLNSSEGWVMKNLFREDPLQVYLVILEKLKYLNMFDDVSFDRNRFVSKDGKNAILIAETSVSITDSGGSKDLIKHTKEIIEANSTRGTTVSFLSGHAYTTANAETIKDDLYTILSCASFAIFLLLAIFMRNWRAIFVYLVPTSVVCIATAAVLIVHQSISAVTIAFGSVLMGIADDYPIFTYFSLRGKGNYTGETVARIARPVLFSGITTMATFSALFFSELPGQRQIAVFSIAGITASLAFSLIILPHFLKGLPSPGAVEPKAEKENRNSLYRWSVIALWLVVMAFCLWQGSRIKFNGDMRAISMIPKTILDLEEDLKRTWGDFRGMAMIFTEGDSLEEALRHNDRLFGYLREKAPSAKVVSIAPILPSEATQEENRRRWLALWTGTYRQRAQQLFIVEGEKTGFTATAFDPFFGRFNAKPSPVTIEDLQAAGLGDAIDALVVRDGTSARILTLVPDTPEVAALFERRSETPFTARFVSASRFNETISRAMVKNFAGYIATASVVILILLIVLFRNARNVFYAAIPVITGLFVMFGVMGWKGIEFNIFNIIATILVIGLSVDLGIFMVSRASEGNDPNTNLAVLLGGLTSLVGMGALTLARHPALSSIGVSVLLGMCGAIPSALFVIPAMRRTKERNKAK